MVELYPSEVYETPPTEFDDRIIELAEKVQEAVKGWGTDEMALVDQLGDETATDRLKLYYCYKEQYGKDIKDVMKSELGNGNLGMAMQLLVLPLDQAEAKMLHMAMKGIGTSEHLIYPIICGRTNNEINKLRGTYFSLYETDLLSQLQGELSGDYEKLITYNIQGIEKEYDEEYFNDDKIQTDATAFYEAGQGSWGTDESSIFNIIAESPSEHLIKVNEQYIENNEITLIGAINGEMGGDVAKGTKYAIGMKLKPAKTAAIQIAKACEGFGTDELALTCAIIRYQAIMGDVNEAHIEEYDGQTIIERIESEVSRKYKKLLVKMVEHSL